MRRKILFIILLILSACSSRDYSNNHYSEKSSKNSQFLRLPIDTLEVISKLNLTDSLNLIDSIFVDNQVGLRNKLDTLDLVYNAVMCDCPDWSLLKEYREQMNSNSEFNLSNYSFYLEPYNDKIRIEDKYVVTGNLVRFIGKEYNESGYPKNVSFDDPNPPKGKVFRYYAYKIYRPYEIWGPNIIDDDVDLNGDTLVHAIQLTIK